jgi:hypothetical protein
MKNEKQIPILTIVVLSVSFLKDGESEWINSTFRIILEIE